MMNWVYLLNFFVLLSFLVLWRCQVVKLEIIVLLNKMRGGGFEKMRVTCRIDYICHNHDGYIDQM